MPHESGLIVTIAVGLASAWLLGILARKLSLSPIVGYLLAGVVIGPYTPGFVGDVGLAGQLAEIGVILLMFGVGLHFHVKDLLAVKKIAIPGALVQSTGATLLGLATALAFGWTVAGGLVLGLALSVASTVVLTRVLEDRQLLGTIHGHVATGWLIVQDILTVVVLVTIPALAGAATGGGAPRVSGLAVPVLMAIAKLAVLVTLVLLGGSRLLPWILEHAARLRSRELFTLTVLTVAITIATASTYFFGVSMALGAFLAGMVVGQSPLGQQAAADALPLRDAFAVLFFVSVGMLFDPAFLLQRPGLVMATLAIIFVATPLIALTMVAAVGYSVRTALTVALGLAQIGEFSFILAALGREHGLLPAAGQNVVSACALISISLNPLVVRLIDPLEAALRARPRLWSLLNARADRNRDAINLATATGVERGRGPLGVVVGYGPVGQAVERVIRQGGLQTLVIDMNPDTVKAISDAGGAALYGDASLREILKQAGVARASHLVVTLPHSLNRVPLIMAARDLNPSLRILVRARYLLERRELEQAGASAACFEEAEAAVALAQLVLQDLGKDGETIARETARIRNELE